MLTLQGTVEADWIMPLEIWLNDHHCYYQRSLDGSFQVIGNFSASEKSLTTFGSPLLLHMYPQYSYIDVIDVFYMSTLLSCIHDSQTRFAQ